MIVSFADKRTKDVYDGAPTRSLPPDLIERARRKLDRIDAATAVTDLRVPPGNRLENWSVIASGSTAFVFPRDGAYVSGGAMATHTALN